VKPTEAKQPQMFLYSSSMSNVKRSGELCSDSVKRHLPIEYAADLTPVVAGKEAGASWNARGMAETG
jgi:hypothetical protein